jgi:hypothetical protein
MGTTRWRSSQRTYFESQVFNEKIAGSTNYNTCLEIQVTSSSAFAGHGTELASSEGEHTTTTFLPSLRISQRQDL